MQLPPLSLYIHVPWCIRKCPYCDFNSHAAGPELPEAEYITALLADLDSDLAYVQGRELSSIFIGGGTPSLLSVVAYERLFAGLRQRLTFAADIEITLEANPGTFEAEKFKGYRQLGINRLSIGIQSFQNTFLQRLGRVHDGEQALKAVQMAKDAGFDNFNLDLMHGLPGQNIDHALADLRQALAFEPPHLSWYQLTIEPNTEFYKRPPKLPEDDALWDIQEAGLALLAEHGYEHYEISAHAKAGKQARHNLNYWQFGDYLGIGAGAHGKITLPQHNEIFRTQKTRMPKDYLNPNKINKHSKEPIAPDEIGLECLMNALRLKQGIAVKDFEQRTGLSLESVAKPVQKAQQLGLLQVDERLYASDKGQQYLNELLALFLA
ncbi:MAG: radical SAM family heme chaperone HemW [Venatoribacter sp.]